MTRTHQLEATLKALRLSGMLDTFEARLTQARAGDLGHVEFLQALCEDELSRRQAAGITRRVRAAHFEQVCAIEDYDFNYNPKMNRPGLLGDSIPWKGRWSHANREDPREAVDAAVYTR
jgi:DNA replication protein DnaC